MRLLRLFSFFFFNDTPPPEIYPLSLHDALPISSCASWPRTDRAAASYADNGVASGDSAALIGHAAQTGQITPSRFISATAWAARPSQSLSTDRKSTRLNSSH